MEFFDSHCHFDSAVFDNDRAQVWQACQRVGVQRLVIPGVAPQQWPVAAQICAGNTGIFYAAGIHPRWINDVVDVTERSILNPLRNRLMDQLASPHCIALGECGLDKMIQTPLALQQHVLAWHLDLASELSLPLIIHAVKAHSELLAQLKKIKLTAGGVIHAFSGSYDIACEYWKLGFYLGIGGTITYERAHKTRDAVKRLPLAALVLETDAPDMPVCCRQGQRNSPDIIPVIAQTLADLRNDTLQHIAHHTTANAQQLFRL